MNKKDKVKINISSSQIREMFHSWRPKPGEFPGWEFVGKESKWDGGEERYNSSIWRNIAENYLLSISNSYDSWDEYWDPMLSIVEGVEVVVKSYSYIAGVELV